MLRTSTKGEIASSEIAAQSIRERAQIEADRNQLARIDRDLDKLVQALAEGMPAVSIKAMNEHLGTRKTELTAGLMSAEAAPPLLPPPMAELCRGKVFDLYAAFERKRGNTCRGYGNSAFAD